ncbi:MAG: hypothetical protein AAFV72_21265 [Cyanobacteria bacterium J06635_1]
MSTPTNDEFYVNYGKIPPSYRRFLVKFIPLLVIGAILFALIFPRVHDQFNLGKIQGVKEYEGFLATNPVPHIIVPRPGNTAGEAAFSRYILSATNKAGPSPKILEQAGNWVTLSGILVSRNNLSVVAVRSAEPLDPPAGVTVRPDEGVSLGEFALDGEIVDGKCYPGIMKPGRTKTHRACAIRCISGGVPAVFRVSNGGDVMYFLLADLAGEAVNDRVLDLVADDVRITGEVIQYDDMYVIQSDPASYERLG